jgi:hypothetical protein
MLPKLLDVCLSRRHSAEVFLITTSHRRLLGDIIDRTEGWLAGEQGRTM